ncbi:hypothetical protein T265_01434 [Opisthorchis viverrini]|uniref:Uncharacterized protein n=1 Tax=Opisthorchis viverrini TaxID=6198 RepID=A0A074ZZQ5_OPIVI|nr:hypothetical protein T265_01434 [Opisthorchis viverrini]KER32561.1 hypothetical protein T265_01434 [Opisthorchis viverrini]
MPVTKSLDVNLSTTSATSTPSSPSRSLTVNCSTKIPSHVLHSVSNIQTSPSNGQSADKSSSAHYTPFNTSLVFPSNTNTGFNSMDLLNKSYAFFFASFEKQWTQKLDQLTFRLESYQREQAAMKFQINRLERVMQIFMEQVKPDENSKRHSLWTGSTPLLHSLSKMNSSTTFPTSPQSITNCNSLTEDVNMYRTKHDLNFCTPSIPLPSTTVFTETATNAIPDRWYSNYPPTGRSDAAVVGLTRPFGGSFVNPYLFWHQWMLGLFGATSNSSGDSTSTNCTITTVASATGKSAAISSTAESKHNSGSCSVSAAAFNRLQETHMNQCRVSAGKLDSVPHKIANLKECGQMSQLSRIFIGKSAMAV